MQTGHANAIKGLSIAVIILAAIGIVIAIICWVILGIIGAMLGSIPPDAVLYGHQHGYTHGLEYEYEYDFGDEETLALVSMLVGTLGGIGSALMLICHVVILIAGIIGLRSYSSLDKMGKVFGWAIGGAIAAFFGGGFIAMILLIIMAVFANSDKKLAAGTAAYTVPAQAAQAVSYGQVQPTQQVPVEQPVQPVQPVQQAPVEQPVQPIQQAPVEQSASTNGSAQL